MITREWGPLEQELESLGVMREVAKSSCLQHGKTPKLVSDIPFAPEPPEGSYWPVAVSAKEGRCVSFQAEDGKTVGTWGRRFLADRQGRYGPQFHAGIDLFADAGDPIVACERGTIVGWIERFLALDGNPRYTSAILVQHEKVTINYGEIDPKSRQKAKVAVGDTVEPGRVIGYAGVNPGGQTMLHFETYKPGLKTNQRWLKDGSPRPSHLLNPSRYVLFLQQHGLSAAGERKSSGGGANVLKGSTAPSPFLPALDFDAAARENRRWGQKLGWLPSYDAIAWVLGFTDRTPDERTLAEAVSRFQASNGLEVDGVIGPNTWKKLQPLLSIAPASVQLGGALPASVSTPAAPRPTVPGPARGPTPITGDLEAALYDQVRLSWERHGLKPPEHAHLGRISTVKNRPGYSRYISVAYVDDTLRSLNDKGLVSISQDDIDMLQRASNVETGGKLTALNSYDSAYMSVGFMQWTLRYRELQEWIALAPDAFRRYGIELEPTRMYSFPVKRKATPDKEKAIVGAPLANELRSREWGLKFFFASLDLDAVIAEVPRALQIAASVRRAIVDKHGAAVVAHYQASPVLRALVQETHNNRPAYMRQAMSDAAARAKADGAVTTQRFLEIVGDEIRQVYAAKEPKDGPQKAENLIKKTAKRRL